MVVVNPEQESVGVIVDAVERVVTFPEMNWV
ncbi:hypothetical protein [Paenibacillus baimaensis]